jgi:phosphate transport system permease protein
MAEPPSPAPRRPIPERFVASRGTLRLDAFMGWLIRVGGIGVVLAVLGILVFITVEIVPLFGSAKVGEKDAFPVGASDARLLGVDEAGRMPFIYDGARELRFIDKDSRVVTTLPLPIPDGVDVTASSLAATKNRITLGLSDGQIGSVLVTYTASADGSKLTPTVKAETFSPIGLAGQPLRAAAFGDGGTSKLMAALQGDSLHAILIREKRSLMGAGKPEVAGKFDLTPALEDARPRTILSSSVGDSIIVITESEEVCYFALQGSELKLRQRFTPFADLPGSKIARADYIFGDVSLVISSDGGANRVFSLYNQPIPGGTGEQRMFGETKRFDALPGAPTWFVASQRNKSFITGTADFASIRYSTTETIRWEDKVPFSISLAAINSKNDHLFLLDDSGTLHRYDIDDPHPEAGMRAFFGKVWYEGASAPAFSWQSTGGSDEFEPKLSLTPLIIGSLKGTLYALLFAVPIALLAAIYSANFLPLHVKRVVKPAMELMASLPSVVLGFLAGLWLAPIVEDRIPSILLVLILTPLTALLCGVIWCKLSSTTRARFRMGSEWWLLAVPALVALVSGWMLGPWLESWAFTVTDATGRTVADFRLWWPEVTGLPYDQRNSLVVGFMMGFAVIPIIFTIADDALTNVPTSLKAAAMALGATRWQVVRMVCLPIASPGIFSALMIGFGRAVGETMIVVMATGNTPITDFNIFSGMRTLSANIAVELPEAAVHSTHYRALFLGALLLFALTFVLNTAAELMRQRLRDKFKVI